MINSRLVNISLLITVFFSFLFVLFPELDLSFSKFFFTKETGFIYRKNFLVYQIYKLLPLLTKLFTFSCLLYLAYIAIRYRNFGKIIRSGMLFLLISSVTGPGLVVNVGLKENFGRARPRQIEQFAGTKEFTPAFKMTDQCKTNCSFSSGHAAMGYFFTAIAYTTSLFYFNRIYIAGLVFGSIVGLSRVIMGGHFLSDIIVSAFIVLFLNHIIFILWQTILKNIRK